MSGMYIFHKLCGNQFSMEYAESKFPVEFCFPLVGEFTLFFNQVTKPQPFLTKEFWPQQKSTFQIQMHYIVLYLLCVVLHNLCTFKVEKCVNDMYCIKAKMFTFSTHKQIQNEKHDFQTCSSLFLVHANHGQ